MTQYLRTLGAVLLAALMTACGGGGGSAGTVIGGSAGSSATPPASIEVFSSGTQLSSATNSSVTFTVVAKDANNQAIPNQTVTFSASSGNLTGALPAPKTGSAGQAITSVSLAPGADADLTLVNLEKERIVKADELGSYSDYSLYDGWKFKGWPVRTIVRGVTVMDEGKMIGAAGHGKYLFRRIGQAPIVGKTS